MRSSGPIKADRGRNLLPCALDHSSRALFEPSALKVVTFVAGDE